MSYETTDPRQIAKIFEKKPWLIDHVDINRIVPDNTWGTTYSGKISGLILKIRTGFNLDDNILWYASRTLSEALCGQWCTCDFFNKNGQILTYQKDMSVQDTSGSCFNIFRCKHTVKTLNKSTIEVLRELRNQKPWYMLKTQHNDLSPHIDRYVLTQTPDNRGFESLLGYAEYVLERENTEETRKLEFALKGESSSERDACIGYVQKLREILQKVDDGDITKAELLSSFRGGYQE